MPNLKFLAFTVPEMLGGPKIPKVGHVTPLDPFLPNFGFFSFALTAVHLCAKFEVSSFKRSRDIRGFQKSKIGSRDPFRQFLHFLLVLTAFHICAKFEVSSYIPPRDIRGSQNSKSGSRDPHVTLFDPILYFFSLVLTAIHLGAKFEVCSFYRSGDIIRSQKSKIGSRDPYFSPFDLIFHFFVSTHCKPYLCQI